ncbi:MAG: glycosyltransferase family 2 protein [Chitinophagaceae bacterium]|nr:MAG: glycosyltransferase family 2 protein [Chitinophagaceae bacterium]
MNAPGNIFIIVPCFNEASVVANTVVNLLKKGYRVLVVDDASADDTGTALQQLPVYYVRHAINLGQGAALRTGISLALELGADFIVTFDADGQHDADDISPMLNSLVQNSAEIVFGSRFLPGSQSNIPGTRKLVLRFARYFNYFASGILLTDANNGLRVMTGKAASKLLITENRSTHSAQIQSLVKQSNLCYAEYPVNVTYTVYSRRKGLKNINSVRILFDLLLFKVFR